MLEKLFSDILYTTDNPAVFNTEEVFKFGNIIKKTKHIDTFNLVSGDIISEIKRSVNKKEIKFLQSGFLRFFRKYNIKNLTNEFTNLDNTDWIIAPQYVKDVISVNCDVYVMDVNEVIIGSRLSKCVINTNTKEYYINPNSFLVITLS